MKKNNMLANDNSIPENYEVAFPGDNLDQEPDNQILQDNVLFSEFTSEECARLAVATSAAEFFELLEVKYGILPDNQTDFRNYLELLVQSDINLEAFKRFFSNDGI